MDKVIDSNKNHLTILHDDGKVSTVANTDYYYLKYDPTSLQYRDETNRIFYFFNDDEKIQETYNNKIFNLLYHGKLYQSRQDEVDMVCKFILNKDKVGFKLYVEERYQLENCQDILKKMLFAYEDRMKFIKRGVLIDNTWLIKYDGNAMIKHNYDSGSRYESLCLVADGYIRKQYIETVIGTIEMSRIMQTILAKITFCLKPQDHLKDKVFINQLPKKLLRVLHDEHKQEMKDDKFNWDKPNEVDSQVDRNWQDY